MFYSGSFSKWRSPLMWRHLSSSAPFHVHSLIYLMNIGDIKNPHTNQMLYRGSQSPTTLLSQCSGRVTSRGMTTLEKPQRLPIATDREMYNWGKDLHSCTKQLSIGKESWGNESNDEENGLSVKQLPCIVNLDTITYIWKTLEYPNTVTKRV